MPGVTTAPVPLPPAGPVLPAAWAGPARAGLALHWVVCEEPPPGAGPRLRRRLERLRSGGVRVLGRLDCAFGARTYAELAADARLLLGRWPLGGFYLDRSRADRGGLPSAARVNTLLTSMLADAGVCDPYLVRGHGRYPDPGYAEIAGQLVTFDGPWSDYRWSEVPQWTARYPPERFCHLVHGVPRPHVETALRIARWQGAGSVLLTDRERAVRSGGRRAYWEDPDGAVPERYGGG